MDQMCDEMLSLYDVIVFECLEVSANTLT